MILKNEKKKNKTFMNFYNFFFIDFIKTCRFYFYKCLEKKLFFYKIYKFYFS